MTSLISLTLIKAGVALLAGAVAGYFLRQLIAHKRRDELEIKAKQVLLEAKESVQHVLEF